MSSVYRAVHIRLGNYVALKILEGSHADDESFRERFVRESRAAAALNHPNVIPIYDAGDFQGTLFIAMRFVDGPDLKQLIRNDGPLEPAITLPIVGQIAAALDAAHAHGLIHRDVKPANVLLTQPTDSESMGHVYLADFGLTRRSKRDPGLTKAGQFVGTIDYVAPEQVLGKSTVDARTDVYSLGCVLFECLTGAAPFSYKQGHGAILWAHVNEEPPKVTSRRSDIDDRIDAVVAKAMAKAQDDRYPTCGALVAALRLALMPPSPSGGDQAPLVTLAGQRLRQEEGLPDRTRAAGPIVPAEAEGPPSVETSPPPGVPEAKPPRRRARGRRLLTLVLAALVGGTAGAGAVALAMRGRTRGTQPAATPNGTASTTCAVGTAHFSSDSETCDLKDHIPARVVSQEHCEAVQPSALNADVGIICTYQGTLVQYNLYHDRLAVDIEYNARRIKLNIPSGGAVGDSSPCDRVDPGGKEGPWHVQALYDEKVTHVPGYALASDRGTPAYFPRTGRFFCYLTSGGQAGIEWLDSDVPIYSIATASQADIRTLYRQWQHDLGPFHPGAAPQSSNTG